MLLCLAVLILPGCASKSKVFSDFDPRHDFSQDRTFTWVQDPPMLRAGDYIVSPLAESRMTAAIKGELIAKGYTFVTDQSEADFSVLYTMGARDKIQIRDRPNPYYSHRTDWGWGAYYFPYFIYFPFESRYRGDINTYISGTIAVDMFEVKRKQPIWHTTASNHLSNNDLKSNAKNAKEIALSLLQHFPVIGCKIEISTECKPFD
jgi:predicted heme/steroid binding protein